MKNTIITTIFFFVISLSWLNFHPCFCSAAVVSSYKHNNNKEALLLCSEENILWVIGVRQSVDSYVQKNDKKVIEFSILKNSVQS